MNAEQARYDQEWVRTFQRKLYGAAKRSATRHFGILYDKVVREDVMREAWRRVRRNRGSAGVDHQSIQWIEEQVGVQRFLDELRQELAGETYQPGLVRRVWIPKPGRREKRPLGVPTVRDRVAQMAVKLIIEPLFEADFLEVSYGYRPKRSARQAVNEIYRLSNSRKWVVEVDLKSYFDTIPHDRLRECLYRRISDRKVKRLLRQWLEAGVLDDGKVTVPDRGSPQGGVLSPLLSNIYLHQFDTQWDEADGKLIRYADDFVILCRTRHEAGAALAKVRELMAELGLVVNEQKTRVVHLTAGFDFLGFTFRQGCSPVSGRTVVVKLPRKSKVRSLVRRVKEKLQKTCLGLTIREAIARINPTLRGWATYFRIGHSYTSAQQAMHGICEQLRLFLRRRHARKRSRGYRYWPNRFFYQEGLLYVPALVR
jgi:group II intron reverse transcriptase/maturase